MAEPTDLERLTTWVRHRIGEGVPRPVKLDVSGVGVIRVVNAEVNNVDGPADLVITISAQTLHDVWNDKVNPLKMPTGAVKVSNKLLALQMTPILIRLLTSKPS